MPPRLVGRAAVWKAPSYPGAVHPPTCTRTVDPCPPVTRRARLSGVIDWDTTSPGPRLWDLAHLAHRLVPLTDPANGDGLRSHVDLYRRDAAWITAHTEALAGPRQSCAGAGRRSGSRIERAPTTSAGSGSPTTETSLPS
ncbi:phosphotransferase [Kineococcus auxinigenes]|uniref:phosphotransferase n=1 Tax=unclassified Kineococcus TaxID=2621656 RepID=UPI003D7D15AD